MSQRGEELKATLTKTRIQEQKCLQGTYLPTSLLQVYFVQLIPMNINWLFKYTFIWLVHISDTNTFRNTLKNSNLDWIFVPTERALHLSVVVRKTRHTMSLKRLVIPCIQNLFLKITWIHFQSLFLETPPLQTTHCPLDSGIYPIMCWENFSSAGFSP